MGNANDLFHRKAYAKQIAADVEKWKKVVAVTGATVE